jgi:hypothetical protein
MSFSKLRIYSIIYLAIPSLIFILAWFRWEISVIITIGYLYLIKLNLREHNDELYPKINWKDILFIILFSFAWTAVTGVGELFEQTPDFVAHNSKHYDLYKNDWPIFFSEVGQYACYYFGYYLVPALVSKMLGSFSVLSIFLWTWLGMSLGISWIYLITNKNKFLLVVFPFLWNMPFQLPKLIALVFPDFPDPHYFAWMWTLYNQSLWVPNQMIPIFIVSGIILYNTSYRSTPIESFFPITICFVWAVFPAVIFLFIFSIIIIVVKWRSLLTIESLYQIVIPGVIFIPTFVYLMSSDGLPVKGFMWEFYNFIDIYFVFFAGIILEIFTLILLTRVLSINSNRFSFALVLCVYAGVIPLLIYKIGFANDFQIRGVLPIAVIGSMIFLNVASDALKTMKETKSKYYYALIFLLGLSFFKPEGLGNSIFHNKLTSTVLPTRFTYRHFPFDAYPNTYQMLLKAYSAKEAKQYLGKKNSFYERFLIRSTNIPVKLK